MENIDLAEVPASVSNPPGPPAGLPPLLLIDPECYRTTCPGAADVWRSPESMRYWLRVHRDELVECAAIVAPIGRQMINPPAFADAVLRIGQRLAGSLRR